MEDRMEIGWQGRGAWVAGAAGWAIAAAAGCNGGKGEDTGTEDCTSVLLSSFPEDGATGVYPGTVIDAVIGRPEADATLTVTDSAGNPVAGALTVEDRRVLFVPDPPLVGGETYTSLLDWSCEDVVATFTVADDIGGPVDATSLVGRTYLMDLTAARYAWPPSLEDAMVVFLQAHLLLAVEEAATDLQFSAGSALFAADPVQDLCSATTSFDTRATFDNPNFSVHLDELSLEVVSDDFVMQDLTIRGTFRSDGSTIEGVSIDGVLDAASLVTELDQPDAAGVCNLFAAQGVDCEVCPGGSDPACIPMVLDSMTLTPIAADLVPRTRAEIDVDPTCAAR